MHDVMKIGGRYAFRCLSADGEELWTATIDNLLATVGKNLALDTIFAGSSYSVTGPYMGLISSVSYGAGPNAADTMASHAGWTEAGATNNPTYSGSRKTCVFSAAAAGAKALSAALSFTIVVGGTVKGAFVLLGAGASATIDNTGGTLYSAGLFAEGDQVVSSTNIIQVSMTQSM